MDEPSPSRVELSQLSHLSGAIQVRSRLRLTTGRSKFNNSLSYLISPGNSISDIFTVLFFFPHSHPLSISIDKQADEKVESISLCVENRRRKCYVLDSLHEFLLASEVCVCVEQLLVFGLLIDVLAIELKCYFFLPVETTSISCRTDVSADQLSVETCFMTSLTAFQEEEEEEEKKTKKK